MMNLTQTLRAESGLPSPLRWLLETVSMCIRKGYLLLIPLFALPIFRAADRFVIEPSQWVSGPIDFLVLLAAIGLGFVLWRGITPSRRDGLLTLPLNRTVGQLSVVVIGGLLTVLAVTAGVYISLLRIGSLPWIARDMFTLGFLPSAVFLPMILATLNAFLLASLVALTSDRPREHMLLGILLLASMYFVGFMIDSAFVRGVLAFALPPYGILAGLGLNLDVSGGGPWILPAFWALPVWTMILAGANVWAASRHR